MKKLKTYMRDELGVEEHLFKTLDTEEVAIRVMKAMHQAYQVVTAALDNDGEIPKESTKKGFSVVDRRKK